MGSGSSCSIHIFSREIIVDNTGNTIMTTFKNTNLVKTNMSLSFLLWIRETKFSQYKNHINVLLEGRIISKYSEITKTAFCFQDRTNGQFHLSMAQSNLSQSFVQIQDFISFYRRKKIHYRCYIVNCNSLIHKDMNQIRFLDNRCLNSFWIWKKKHHEIFS